LRRPLVKILLVLEHTRLQRLDVLLATLAKGALSCNSYTSYFASYSGRSQPTMRAVRRNFCAIWRERPTSERRKMVATTVKSSRARASNASHDKRKKHRQKIKQITEKRQLVSMNT
jgi:hypothetical protein